MESLELPRDDDPAITLLPLGDAARHMGLSVDTVRRRIKDGTLTAHKVATRHGPAWRVELAAGQLAIRPADEHEPSREVASRALLDLLTTANERLTTLAEQVGYLRARLEAAEAEIAGLRAQLARRGSAGLRGHTGAG
jgi:hypothetical protein